MIRDSVIVSLGKSQNLQFVRGDPQVVAMVFRTLEWLGLGTQFGVSLLSIEYILKEQLENVARNTFELSTRSPSKTKIILLSL